MVMVAGSLFGQSMSFPLFRGAQTKSHMYSATVIRLPDHMPEIVISLQVSALFSLDM